MTTHLSTVQIKTYLERSLSRDELARTNAHLYSCETCYQQFLIEFQTQRRFPIEIDLDELAGLKGWHLQGEELKAYAEGRMSDLDLDHTNLHLHDCAWCNEEVEHYLEFSNKLEYYLSKRHSPIKQPDARSKPYAKLREIFITWSPARIAGATALILLLLGSATVLWSVLRTKPEEQAAAASEQSTKDSPLLTLESSNAPRPIQSTPPDTKANPGQPPYPKRETRRSNSDHPDNSPMPDRRMALYSQLDTETSLIATNLVIPPVIEMFDNSSVVLRGDDSKSESFNLIGPFRTVIGTDQPTFRWTALTGAASYTVSVYDARLNLIKTSEPLSELHWTMPSRLERGVVYTWVVTALKDGKEILAPTLPARAEFKIIEKPVLDKLNLSIRQIGSAAARGVLYARAGLLDAAEQELQAHLTVRPDDQIAKNLLRKIKSWREP